MDCPRCEALSQEIEHIRHELVQAGRTIEAPQSISDNDLERELARFLSTAREPDAAAGYRAGWRVLARVSRPRFREWEQLWWQAVRETDRLRAHLGNLLRETSRLTDSG